MGKVNMLVPQYMRKFKCIGSECEDTCCKEWSIQIDYKTYTDCVRFKDKEMAKQFDEVLVRNRKDADRERYAYIKLLPNRRCPFLNEQNLCSVYINCGEKYMSHTCRTYPREINVLNGVFECSATLSCPEAARLALKNPDGIEFDEYTADELIGFIINKRIDEDSEWAKARIYNYLFDIRAFVITILQSRRYRLTDRLIILGLFIQQLQELAASAKSELVPELIRQCEIMLNSGGFDEAFSQFPTNAQTVSVQIKLLKEIIGAKSMSGGLMKKYNMYFNKLAAAFEFENWDDENVAGKYKTAIDEYYEPFMKQHEYLLENYLVNYVFKSIFPLTWTRQPFDVYAVMVIHYLLIKLNLAGIALYNKKLTDDDVVDLIHAFSRAIEHNLTFEKALSEFIEKSKLDTLFNISVMLKN